MRKFLVALILILISLTSLFSCTEPENQDSGSQSQEGADYVYSLDAGGAATITRCKLKEALIELPSQIDGHQVVAIGDNAFFNNSSVKEIIIPEGVKSIGKSAFEHCSALLTVTIPNSLEILGNRAFYDCTKLEDLIISDGSKLNQIGDEAFFACRSLHTSEYGNAKYLAAGAKEHTILLSATNTNISTAEIHENTTIIVSNAFSGCINLKQLEIPENVKYIGNKAFYGCTNMDQIYFNATNMQDLTHGSAVFERVATISKTMTLYVGSNVERIPAYLMDSSTRLRGVTFEGGSVCGSIGRYAFAGTPLPAFTIPKSLKTIEPFAFANCDWLAEIKLDAVRLDDLSESNTVFSGAGKEVANMTLTVGRDAERIPANFCRSMNYLRKVTFENNDVTTSFGKNAFYNCNNIQTVSATSKKGWCESTFENEYSNPLKYGNATLSFNGSSITEGFVISETIDFISDFAFIGYKNLDKIIIPYSVSYIGKDAFSGVDNLYLIYWSGTQDEWESVDIKSGNTILERSSVYFYSETRPTTIGNFWYYDEDTKTPIVWRTN